MTDREIASFKISRRQAVKIAGALGYGRTVQRKIEKAQTEEEITKILHDARTKEKKT